MDVVKIAICDFSRCQTGVHPFIKIMSSPVWIDEEEVIRWCPECGAIVVDCDIDGLVTPGYYKKLRYPNLTKKHGLTDKTDKEKDNGKKEGDT